MIGHRAQAAFERGQEWEERGGITKAIKAYREAVAIEPDWIEPYQRIGTLYLQTGRYDEAAATFRQAEPLAPPGDGSVDNSLHLLDHIQAGKLAPAAYDHYVTARDLPDEQLDEKIDSCQQALALNPSFAAPYAVLGRALLAKGHPNQARVVLERGLTCDPPAFTRATLLFNLGNVLLVIGQRSRALAAFRQVVELDANPPVTRFAKLQLEAADNGRI